MKRVLSATIIAIASSSASVAYAEGAYVGADFIFGHYAFDVSGTTSNNDSANKVSGRILAGYNFNQTWAIEGGYADFGTAKYNFTANGANGSLNASSHSVYVAGKASVPINDAFSLYGKLGAADSNVDREGAGAGAVLTQHVNRSALYAGIGVQYKLTDNLAATLELEHYGPLNSVGGSTVLVSTGLRYKF